MARGSGRRQRIAQAFARLYDAVTRALGAAEGLRAAAVREHAEAIAEMWPVSYTHLTLPTTPYV